MVEYEFCPTFTGLVTGERFEPPATAPIPPMCIQESTASESDEVMEWKWVPSSDVIESARRTPFVFSPWSVRQIAALAARSS